MPAKPLLRQFYFDRRHRSRRGFGDEAGGGPYAAATSLHDHRGLIPYRSMRSAIAMLAVPDRNRQRGAFTTLPGCAPEHFQLAFQDALKRPASPATGAQSHAGRLIGAPPAPSFHSGIPRRHDAP